MSILPIDVNVLPALAGLLEASYGDGFELQDELDWFSDPAPENWFYFRDQDGAPQGFLRFFPVVTGLYFAECYAEPTRRDDHRAALLRHLLQQHSFPSGTRLRFDLRVGDPFESIIEQACQVVDRKVFKHYERQTGTGSPSERWALSVPDGTAIEQARCVLATLKPYSTAELRALMDTEAIHLLEAGGKVVAALHHQSVGSRGCEVVTFAVDERHRGRGHGREMLERFLGWCEGRFETIRLRVEDSNTAASRLYEACGFQSDPIRSERWIYVAL